MERIVWISISFSSYRHTAFKDIPIAAIMAMKSARARTQYTFTVLHRDEADFEKHRREGWQQGTEIAVDQFVEHIIAKK